MKLLLLLALTATNVFAYSISPCNQGPEFWCHNLSNAKICGAVGHCIQTVWEKEEVNNDSDSVCQICLDMVKQARDELESNETISNLKDVFEGSCKLIPLKPIQTECIKMADDFIPELVEALASQMNPQMVCSVAGLCNNVAIDKMLEEQTLQDLKKPSYVGTSLNCNNCNVLSNVIMEKFNTTHKDLILDNALQFCSEMSSFSDACNSIILTYFDSFYNQIKSKFSSDDLCHISGVCSFKFHTHSDPEEQLVVKKSENINDDLPCDLCQQLVKHLKDVLIANTTEDEFKQVLQGLCSQTKTFKTECVSLVNEYYKDIYETLVNNLDANGACFLIGICPKGDKNMNVPLDPANVVITIKKLEDKPYLSNGEIITVQKKVNKVFETQMDTALVKNGELCTICEYFMHFVQETLTLPSNEEKIKSHLKAICSKSMPKSLKSECDDFVDMYGDAVVALLIQEMDPMEICPMMKMCPHFENSKMEKEDNPTCPLCLFAVEQAQIQIKDEKTKENVKKVLNNLCNHFPNNKLKAECVDFVETYTSELINMLVKDFTPQQICVSIKLCSSSGFDLSTINIKANDDEDLNLKKGDFAPTPQCLLCKKVIELVEKELIGEKTKENIVDALKRSCAKFNKKAQGKCQRFVDKYGDLIAELLLKETKPDQVCRELMYCSVQEDDLFNDDIIETNTEVPVCAFCELVMMQIEQEIKTNKTKDEIQSVVLNICHKIPTNLADKCSKVINQYSEAILNWIDKVPPKEICTKIKLCSNKKYSSSENQSPPPCTLCEIIMFQLEQELKTAKTKEEIKQMFLNICQKIPNKYSNQCSKLVGKYSEIVLEMLDSVPPKEICHRINLCLNDLYDEVLECGVCQGVSIFLASQSNKVLSNDEIKYLSCETFPSKYFDKCTEIVDYYAISIQNLIKKGFNENEICNTIGKCMDNEGKHSYRVIMDSHKTKRTLVGDNECTYGPSHWCSSKEVAKKCDLMEYCEKVWKSKKD
ncbi:PSAP family protein [Megaselia abdita]